MENYLIYIYDNFSLDAFLLSLAVFILTMIAKIPLKKWTQKLEENKRQSLNSLIILIPLILSFLISLLWFLIKDKTLLSLEYVSFSVGICIMAIAIYAIYSRVVIILKGFVKKTTTELKPVVKNEQLSSETMLDSENASNIENNEKNMQKVSEKFNALIAFKQQLEKYKNTNNTEILKEINAELKSVELQKNKE